MEQKTIMTVSPKRIETLSMSIIAGLPGSEEEYSLEKFRNQLEYYETINKSDLQKNLIYFRTDYPVAEKFGVRMCIHPDDPRLICLESQGCSTIRFSFILKAIPSLNSLTFCTGSLGVRTDNNLLEIFKNSLNEFTFYILEAQNEMIKVTFTNQSFRGDFDMYEVVRAILVKTKKKKVIDQLENSNETGSWASNVR